MSRFILSLTILFFMFGFCSFCVSEPLPPTTCISNRSFSSCMKSDQNCAWCNEDQQCLAYNSCSNQTSPYKCTDYILGGNSKTCKQETTTLWVLFLITGLVFMAVMFCISGYFCFKIFDNYKLYGIEKQYAIPLALILLVALATLIYIVADICIYAQGTDNSLDLAMNLFLYPLAGMTALLGLFALIACFVFICKVVWVCIPCKRFDYVTV